MVMFLKAVAAATEGAARMAGKKTLYMSKDFLNHSASFSSNSSSTI